MLRRHFLITSVVMALAACGASPAPLPTAIPAAERLQLPAFVVDVSLTPAAEALVRKAGDGLMASAYVYGHIAKLDDPENDGPGGIALTYRKINLTGSGRAAFPALAYDRRRLAKTTDRQAILDIQASSLSNRHGNQLACGVINGPAAKVLTGKPLQMRCDALP